MSDAIEMLAACHDRMQRQFATLRRLAPHLAEHGADEQAKTAAAGVMRFFDTSAVHHHEDEERDLFPALIESMAGSDAVCLRDLTEGLAAEHRALQSAWERVRAVLERVTAGSAATLSLQDVELFADAYARHIEREEKELFPMAARLLGDAEFGEIHRAMCARRGLGG